METREIRRTEVRLYKLILNSIYDRAEGCTLVAVSTNLEALQNWYNSLKVEEYREKEHGWVYCKSFQKGSELECFNPVYSLELNAENGMFIQGIKDEWVNIDLLDDIKSKYTFIE